MENFFYEDEYCSDLCALMEKLELEDADVAKLPDDWTVVVMGTILEPMVELNAEWIIEHIDEERFPEDDDNIYQRIKKALEGVDFKAINDRMPKLYYTSGPDITITKADLLEYIN